MYAFNVEDPSHRHNTTSSTLLIPIVIPDDGITRHMELILSLVCRACVS